MSDPNATRFIAGLIRLGYSVNAAERLIGVPRTTLYRIMRGQSDVPMSALKLLDMYERYGVPEEHKL